MGISITKYKMMAFVTSAALAGGAGALWPELPSNAGQQVRLQHLHPDAGVRGAGRPGQHLGLHHRGGGPTILPEALRGVSDYRMLVYAIVLILVMLATNNPTLKGFFSARLGRIPRAKRKRREAG